MKPRRSTGMRPRSNRPVFATMALLGLAAGLSLDPGAAHAQQGAGRPASAAPVSAAPPAPPVEPPARVAELPRMDIDTGFASVLMARERVVKGAPYCAEALHETVQPLTDGNRIVHQQSSQLCRDGEGRTRQEVDRQGRRVVYLKDPASGESWLLDPARKTARWLGRPVDVTASRDEAQRQREQAQRQRDYAERMREYAERMREKARQHTDALRERLRRGDSPAASDMPPSPPAEAAPVPPTPRPAPAPEAPPVPTASPLPPAPPRPVVIAPAGDLHNIRIIEIGAPDGAAIPTPPIPSAVGLSDERLAAAAGKAKVDTLPAREIEGLAVTGRRITNTIEAGKVGNERPILITTEVWTSPELQLTVSSVRKDPRSGEQNYQLKGIKRGEPDPALMKVPADYRRTGQPAPGKG